MNRVVNRVMLLRGQDVSEGNLSGYETMLEQLLFTQPDPCRNICMLKLEILFRTSDLMREGVV